MTNMNQIHLKLLLYEIDLVVFLFFDLFIVYFRLLHHQKRSFDHIQLHHQLNPIIVIKFHLKTIIILKNSNHKFNNQKSLNPMIQIKMFRIQMLVNVVEIVVHNHQLNHHHPHQYQIQ